MDNRAKELIKQSEYDILTAKDMYKAGRYIYTVFMCHLAIEKALKALVIAHTKNAPPKIHNLIQLYKIAEADLSKKFNKTLANDYLLRSEDVIKCLLKDPRLQK